MTHIPHTDPTGASTTLKEIWSALAPFIAAAVASGLTYAFGIRGKRYDLAQAERLSSFRILKSKLLALKEYSIARAGNIDGGDFDENTESLPPEIPQGFLYWYHDIRRTRDEYSYLLPDAAKKSLHTMLETLGLACSMQLTISYDDAAQMDGAATFYRTIAASASKCVDELFAALKLPV